MTSVMSRTHIYGISTPTGQRPPRKSSSFLSLRRERENPAYQLETPYDPSKPSTSYFDAYPQTQTSFSRSSRPKAQHSASHSTASTPSPNKSPSHSQRRLPKERSSTEPTYAFPSLDEHNGFYSSTPKAGAYSRARSSTGPSGRSNNHWLESDPTIRFSSSSTQQSETPPDTPLDSNPYSFGFPVLVSAPVSGVETMDALVDGMNGGDDALTSSLSRRNRFGIPGHHPLYQPPLPTPPPGVVLGGGKSRVSKKASRALRTRASFSEDEDTVAPAPPPPKPQSRKKPKRPSTSRTASILTITTSPQTIPSPESYSSLDDEPWDSKTPKANHIQPNSEPEAAKSLSYHSRPTSLVEDGPIRSSAPSISDIIRTYAPPRRVLSISSRAPSSNHGHSVHDHQPELTIVESESEMISRSSIDSLADEIQQTLKTQRQSNLRPTPPPPPSSFLTRRHSILSDTASVSPRSEAPSSIFSQPQPLSPDAMNLTPFVKVSPSQEVAQYLRSARLTTLLKLTRSPHASSDNPLTVSLSDLGNPTGYPVVVFLGLGCVRHIMGLYDEMAECLNLRLITIDRFFSFFFLWRIMVTNSDI